MVGVYVRVGVYVGIGVGAIVGTGSGVGGGAGGGTVVGAAAAELGVSMAGPGAVPGSIQGAFVLLGSGEPRPTSGGVGTWSSVAAARPATTAAKTVIAIPRADTWSFRLAMLIIHPTGARH
ncbi:hypothetical protein CRM90_27110 [Mycobacterium sp. ENV421]|nr:hypothetical protein CRM90_27110 [Mycobacterium sp. ENV421]